MLCTNAPSIGFNNPSIAKTVAIKFKVNANPIPALMVLKVFLDTLNKWGKSWILSWIKVIFEASIILLQLTDYSYKDKLQLLRHLNDAELLFFQIFYSFHLEAFCFQLLFHYFQFFL